MKKYKINSHLPSVLSYYTDYRKETDGATAIQNLLKAMVAKVSASTNYNITLEFNTVLTKSELFLTKFESVTTESTRFSSTVGMSLAGLI